MDKNSKMPTPADIEKMFNPSNPDAFMDEFGGKMKQFVDKINSMTFTAGAGDDKVQATVDGKGGVVKLKLNISSGEITSNDDVDVLADLIVAAIKKAQADAMSRMIADPSIMESLIPASLKKKS